jgi:hypothetical protein
MTRRKRKSAPVSHKPPPRCDRAPRMVVVASSILTIQSRLDAIKRRENVLETEFDKLDGEKTTKLSELSTLQREMDKLTATHHVVQQ